MSVSVRRRGMSRGDAPWDDAVRGQGVEEVGREATRGREVVRVVRPLVHYSARDELLQIQVGKDALFAKP